MSVLNRCGTCRHTEPVPNDLTKVTCFGHGVQLLNTSQGPVPVRPQMPKTERACAVWAAKDPAILIGDA